MVPAPNRTHNHPREQGEWPTLGSRYGKQSLEHTKGGRTQEKTKVTSYPQEFMFQGKETMTT